MFDLTSINMTSQHQLKGFILASYSQICNDCGVKFFLIKQPYCSICTSPFVEKSIYICDKCIKHHNIVICYMCDKHICTNGNHLCK